MQQIIISILFALLCFDNHAQEAFGERLLKWELLIYQEQNDSLRAHYALNKVNEYILDNQMVESLSEELKRVDYSKFDSLTKSNFLWNAAVSAYFLDEGYLFTNYMEKYKSHSMDSSIQIDILEYLMYLDLNEVKANTAFDELQGKDSSISCIRCLEDLKLYTVKHPLFRIVSSMVFPGSGMVMNRRVGKGLVSLGLNTSTFFAIRYLVQQNLYFNAVGWGVNLVTKFYLGGIKLTSQLNSTRNLEKKQRLTLQCEPLVKSILEKYPIDFILSAP